jgi:hypothetical protein
LMAMVVSNFMEIVEELLNRMYKLIEQELFSRVVY